MSEPGSYTLRYDWTASGTNVLHGLTAEQVQALTDAYEDGRAAVVGPPGTLVTANASGERVHEWNCDCESYDTTLDGIEVTDGPERPGTPDAICRRVDTVPSWRALRVAAEVLADLADEDGYYAPCARLLHALNLHVAGSSGGGDEMIFYFDPSCIEFRAVEGQTPGVNPPFVMVGLCIDLTKRPLSEPRSESDIYRYSDSRRFAPDPLAS